MASISTAGVGSGIDIPNLVNSLIEAEKTPATKRYDKQEAELLAQVSAFGTLKSALSTFQDSLSSLKFASTFNNVTTSSSNEDVLTATGSSIAKPGNYTLEVEDLAQAHSLSSKSFEETSSPVGTGTLTFSFGSFDSDANDFVSNPDKASKTVTINDDDNSLQGIRDAVNAAKIGVTASIINDGTGYRLQFTSDDTGLDNGLKITVSDNSDTSDTDDSGLSQLAFDPDPSNAANSHMNEDMEAQDAKFTLNGLSITSASNTVNTAISGVTLNLNGTTAANTPVRLNISQNDTKITEAVNGFVEKFNELTVTLKQLSSYDSATEQAGPLLGDSVIRNVESQIRRMLSTTSKGPDGNIYSLSSVGITTNREGQLSLDSSKLQKALSSNRDVLAQIFSAKGQTTDNQVNFVASSKNSQTGEYGINLTTMASRGTLSGSAISSFPVVIDGSNDGLSLLVNGYNSGNIYLTQQTYNSGAELAAELQSKINASDTLKNGGANVLVSFTDNKLNITSALYGSKSTVEITGVTGSALGLSIGKGTTGTDVSGTIGGESAEGKGSVLTGTGTNVNGMILEFTGGGAGNRGTVYFNRGIADQLDNLLTNFLKSGSLIESRTTGLNDRISDLTDKRAELEDKMQNLEARLYQQFNAMDSIVAQLQSTGDYLQQQLSNLPGVVKKDK